MYNINLLFTSLLGVRGRKVKKQVWPPKFQLGVWGGGVGHGPIGPSLDPPLPTEQIPPSSYVTPWASLTASRINMCAVKWAFFIYTTYVSGIPLTMLIIRKWNFQSGTTCFSTAITTLVYYGMYLENWTKQRISKSQSKSQFKHSEILEQYFKISISHIWSEI